MHCSRQRGQLGSTRGGHTVPAPFSAGQPSLLQRPRRQRQPTLRTHAFGDLWKDIFDFNSWAPKSTRIWRLQQYEPPEASGAAADAGATDGLDVLQARINELKDSRDAVGDSSSSSSSSSSSAVASAQPPGPDADDGPASFSDADDDEMSAALSRRIRQIATTTGEWGSSMDEEEMRQPLTGEEIRRLLMSKYGKQYDMSFVRRVLPGMGAVVSLNIMWLHLGQASFPHSAQQYNEKLDGVAELVNALQQTDKVRAFLKAPARSMKGLPRRPVVGTAISIRLDLSREQISDWFEQGYD